MEDINNAEIKHPNKHAGTKSLFLNNLTRTILIPMAMKS